MKIAVFGGTGFVGKHLVQAALDAGHELRVLARNPEKLGDLADRVTVIQGDYFDADKVAETLTGARAVLSTIGPLPGRKGDRTPDDFERGMRQVVAAMKTEGISRIVNIAGAGTSYTGERISFGRKFMRLLLSIMGPVVTPAKEKELGVLMASGLDHTTVRPPMIAENVSGDLKLGTDDNLGMKVDVAQLAGFMVDTLNKPDWVKKMPFTATK